MVNVIYCKFVCKNYLSFKPSAVFSVMQIKGCALPSLTCFCSSALVRVVEVDSKTVRFYPHDAMLVRVIAIATCLSVCRHTPVLYQNKEN